MKDAVFDSRLAHARLSWRPLKDGRLTRMIYVDEAGTSPAEPVRVVAAVIVHPDNEARHLVAEMKRIFDERVPAQLRSNFVFHAKDLFNPPKKHAHKYDGWNFEDRLDLIKEIVCLPFVYDIPIALGVHFNNAYDDKGGYTADLADILGTNKATIEHAKAFQQCLERADYFIRKYLDADETAIVVAEDINERKKIACAIGMMPKSHKFFLNPEHLIRSPAEIELGISNEMHLIQIDRILDVPHFVDKSGAPLLQLSDACAFSFRRFLGKYKYGDELILAMLGPFAGTEFINDARWFSGQSSGLFNTYKYWTE
jgi:hypothetical protein